MSIESLLFQQIEFLKEQIDFLKTQNEWFREMLSKTSFSALPPERLVEEEDEMKPLGGIELPSERRSRLAKKYADLKRELESKQQPES